MTTVIHHSADFDGLFCREIARKFLPDAELIGWDFADKPLAIPDGQIYILDLPVDRVFGMDFKNTRDVDLWGWWDRVIWIDHHKSSIETHPTDIKGYRIDGVAACRLAWQWFTLAHTLNEETYLPSKEMFVKRAVEEPLAVRLAGEYDIWDKRDPRAELFQHGLRSRELNDITWKYLLGEDRVAGEHCVADLLDGGKVLQYARTQENASIIKDLGFTFQWEGLTWLACNHARYNSFLFTAALRPEHDACFGFKFTGHCAAGKPCEEWSVSLYHAPSKEHHDLSLIAVKHGGGGHKGAAGMIMKTLPFLPE